MAEPLRIIVIAPSAPPASGAEAIQVRRILAELDKHAEGLLITAATSDAGWTKRDATLELPLRRFAVLRLSLPFHRLTRRIVMSHRMKRFQNPDAMGWMLWLTPSIHRHIARKPDILYSRSYPVSAAVLAAKLNQYWQVPWVMHLSDPWAENPHHPPHPHDAALEHYCFTQASLIALTSAGQAAHYRSKYPALAQKIIVSPNVLPDAQEIKSWQNNAAAPVRDARLHLVFAGNLYGGRSPQPLLDALALLKPETRAQLRIDFYGQAQEASFALLRAAPDVLQYHGPVSFKTACEVQAAADVLLSIEPEMANPLSKTFLPSKLLDAMALGRPLLAITPPGSEAETICNEGYGWAVPPRDAQAIAARLTALVEMLPQLRDATLKAPPERYLATRVVADLLTQMQRLQQEQSA